MSRSHDKPQQQGFSYIEVLIASMLIALALSPALNALQTGIMSTGIHQALTTQHYQRLKKMEELQAESFVNLLAAAKAAASYSTATSYSDAVGTADRRRVFIALYDADADPFTVTDANADSDNDPYTGATANLLWVKVVTEGNSQSLETLISR